MASFRSATERLAAALEAQPSGTRAIDTIESWLRDEALLVGDEERELRAEMMEQNALLRGAGSARFDRLDDAAARVLSEELGLPASDIAVQIAGGMISGFILQHEMLPGPLRGNVQTARVARAAIEGLLQGLRSSQESSPLRDQ